MVRYDLVWARFTPGVWDPNKFRPIGGEFSETRFRALWPIIFINMIVLADAQAKWRSIELLALYPHTH